MTVVRPFRFALQAMGLSERDEIVTTARRAEALGYEELWSYDHLGAVDPFVPLVVAAEATTTLRIGPLVLNNELHHPGLLARTAATVDRLTGGRLVLGLGTGYAQAEHDALDLELRPPGRRVDRLGESIEVLRALLDTGTVDHDGEHHHVHVADLGVRPAQARVPFLVGGHGRRVVALAARHADIFQLTGLTHGEGGRPEPGGFAPETVAERVRWLADAAGERDADIERSLLVQATDVGPHADAGALAERFGRPPDELEATPFVLVGSVEQVVDELERRRRDLGVSHVVVRDAEGFAPVVAALAGR